MDSIKGLLVRHFIAWGQRLKKPCLPKVLGGSEIFTRVILESHWLVLSWPACLLCSSYLTKPQTNTQCFDSKERYQKNKYLKF